MDLSFSHINPEKLNDLESLRKALVEVLNIVEQQNQIILKLKQQNEELRNRIAKLEKDSSNSSKPPGTDLKRKDNTNRSLRQRTGKKQGGQKGHQGVTMVQVEDPDKIERCTLTSCQACGIDLDSRKGVIIGKRQEIDLPPISPIVTEYQQIGISCKCGHYNKGHYPQHIKAPIQIGANMQSFLIYLNIVQLIPFKRLSILCKDLLNFPLCKRSIENILRRCSKISWHSSRSYLG